MSEFWVGFVVGELIGLVLGAAFMYKMAHQAIVKAHERATEAMFIPKK